jgi:hypothetical protein
MPGGSAAALIDVERKEVLRVLHEPDHVDEAYIVDTLAR